VRQSSGDQFWILPSVPGHETSVQQRQHTIDDRTDRWLQIMGPAGEDGLDLAQDARALVTRLTRTTELKWSFDPGRGGYLYVIDGEVTMNGTSMSEGTRPRSKGRRIWSCRLRRRPS
jgi:redox-sensitive bicupin YhaK (pirin superfamily)